MPDQNSASSWFYPKPTGNPGRDRNARTIQFTCLLLAFGISAVVVLNSLDRSARETPLLIFGAVGLFVAVVINRAGMWEWAARIAVLAMLLTATLLVFEARDGFRSHAMLVFPGMLLISVMLLDRASYVVTAGVVLVAVAALGMSEKRGLTRAIPRVRTSTTYGSIFFVDLNLLVFGLIGSRIVRDAQRNVFDLRATLDQVVVANRELSAKAEALRDSEERFRATFMNSADALLIVTLDEGTILDVNEAFERLYGYRREETVGKTTRQLDLYTQPLDVPRTTGNLGANRWLSEFETVARKKGGEAFTASLATNAFLLGGRWHLAAAVRDISERKQAVAALRENEQHLKNAERIAHLGHWQWDLQSNLVSGSDEMYRIFGKPQELEPSYSGFLDDLSPRDRQRVQELIQDSLSRRVGNSIEYKITHPNGDVRTISCIWEVLLGATGAPVRLFGTCQDITEARRLREEALATQKLESVGTLASGIAHDFNNLLAAVAVQAELALAQHRAGLSPEEELRTIREVAMRGSEIVRELMIYAGKESEVLERVDVSQLVEQMLELLKISVSKHVELKIELAEHLPLIEANAAKISQLVLNLVVNASEAIGDREGVIRINTGRSTVEDGSPGLERLTAGDYVRVEVSDDGCGMSPETKDRMFDPFFTTKSAGRGLGLAVADGVVRSLGGAIQCKSELDQGTAFRIFLPSLVTAAGQHRESPAREAAPMSLFGGCVVLVVEDEDPLRLGMVKILRRNGFEVTEVANGTAAIDLLHASDNKIDVILLDMTIPGASSRDVASEALRIQPDIKIVLTSAYSEEMVRTTMGSTLIHHFIRKPFEFSSLVQVLKATLNL